LYLSIQSPFRAREREGIVCLKQRNNSVPSDVKDITVNYEENGILLVKELDKDILSKGSWATVMFKYQQWEAANQRYGPVLYTIRRYRKRNDDYRQQSKFNISSIEQAKKIIGTLRQWIDTSEKETGEKPE
jgi:hypothetical protein